MRPAASSTVHHPIATATAKPAATPLPKGWNQVASPGVGSEGNLMAVAATSASDAWAVGQYEGLDSLQRTLIEHWGGAQWSYVISPSPGQTYNILLGVSADSANDAWAVGYSSNSPTGQAEQPLTEHWNGSVERRCERIHLSAQWPADRCVRAVGGRRVGGRLHRVRWRQWATSGSPAAH
ncbi:MAG TPA: hypothetical protein VGS80_11395 [Ktedonobacterales bacterium]|nr:hypothetical protein [Ktedonobacterales bacterium]